MELVEMLESLGVDVDTTLYRFGGNQVLLERFMKKFPDDQTFRRLEKGIQDQDSFAVEEQAHNLKGLAANLGFQQLSNHCNALVWDVRNGTMDQVDSHFQQLKENYLRIVDGIRSLC